jgi:hypothetical protein
VCRVVVLEGGFEGNLEAFEEGGTENILEISVEKRVQFDWVRRNLLRFGPANSRLSKCNA